MKEGRRPRDRNRDRNLTVTVGLDVGDEFTRICILDAEGAIVEEGRVATIHDSIRQRFAELPRSRIALEVGKHSPWIADLLEELGHEVFVANARKLRLIFQEPVKDDRLDAARLARAARFDPQLLAPIRHRSLDARADREILRARDAIVRVRTGLINHLRCVVKSFGSRLPTCDADSFHTQAAPHIPPDLQSSLAPLVDTIRDLTARMRGFDKKIEALARAKYPAALLLRSVTGVGPITSLAYVLTIEDPGRFKKSRDVGSYIGLTPRRDRSGESDRQLRITKAGDRMLRRLLVQCAHYILRCNAPDSDLRRWGLAYKEKGGKNASKRAVVALARKLAVLMHRLWTNREAYEPLHHAQRIAPRVPDSSSPPPDAPPEEPDSQPDPK